MRYEAWQSSGRIALDTVRRVNYGTVDRREYPTPPNPTPALPRRGGSYVGCRLFRSVNSESPPLGGEFGLGSVSR